MAENIRNSRIQKVKFGDEIAEIQTVLVDGIECLLLEDVQEEFPSVSRFRIGNVQQSFIRDGNGNKLEPLRIKACVDQIVETMKPKRAVQRSNQVAEVLEAKGESDEALYDLVKDIKMDVRQVQQTSDLILNNTQEMLIQINRVMTQMYELHEYTTPRYFFILPEKHSAVALINNIQNWFHLHYKLFFLCECSDDPNKIHIAPHDGYSIKKTRDFIMTYGPYLRTTLNIVKFLLTAVGVVIPQLGNVSTVVATVIPSQLQSSGSYETMQQQLQLVNKLLDKFDNQESRTGFSVLRHKKSQVAPLQGAELRELDTYLELIDNKRSLGNLYRIVTADGHVRWVCLEHYDEISYNKKMGKYIDEFEAMGGKFDEKTKEAIVIGAKISEKNIRMLCDALINGFNIQKLMFQQCSLFESDLGALLAVVLNRSSIHNLIIATVEVRRLFSKNYVCKRMTAELRNRSFKVRFYDSYQDGNELMLAQLLQQNKIHQTLDLSACDFLWHEQNLQQCLNDSENITGLIVEYSNNTNVLNTIFTLKKSALHQLKLTNSLREAPTLYHFCEMLKKNKTLVDIDLLDQTDFEDEALIVNLLAAVRSHKSIKNLNLHIQGIRPSNQKEIHLIKSLKEDKFISHLCISTSDVSRELTEAFIYASKEHKKLVHLEFYNCQMMKDDKEKLQSLQNDASLIHLTFSKQPRCCVTAEEANSRSNKVIPEIPVNARWAQNGVTVAGGHGYGSATNQLKGPYGLFIDDDQTIVIADYSNHRIVQWKMGDTNGQIVAGHIGFGKRLDQLDWPTDVLIDKETDSLIINDRGNNRVLQWSRRSGIKPSEILIDKETRSLIVNHQGNDRVFKWARRSDMEPGKILIDNVACYGLAMDDQKCLYVSDTGKDEVRRYQIGDKKGTVVAGGNGQGAGLNQLSHPTYIFVDRQQTVYVSDTSNHRVMKWNKGATEGVVVAGGQGQGNALTQLSSPHGLFVDTLSTLYVADSGNQRVMHWPKGSKQGTVIVGGNDQGQEPNQFHYPRGLSFDHQGNLYAADENNCRVQRFSIQ
ncbi:unnamed protein product [Rotaria socialis]|uniref:Uncharacterized protein n=1 Tax=Rotaria socialis TaxID=392032 RepID=A0A818EDS9_9BILA|nr:unnamed protein product [Rotaria socialis]CAF4365643.1 unnamed protein product [Rotaria socialis]